LRGTVFQLSRSIGEIIAFDNGESASTRSQSRKVMRLTGENMTDWRLEVDLRKLND